MVTCPECGMRVEGREIAPVSRLTRRSAGAPTVVRDRAEVTEHGGCTGAGCVVVSTYGIVLRSSPRSDTAPWGE